MGRSSENAISVLKTQVKAYSLMSKTMAYVHLNQSYH